ncbi:MAG: hypothetical protein Q8J74_05920 [Candidatus Didemnitutus sp.]|nr:hypothetical protein [Candidatus Didemnitutus sp.]
MPKAASSNSKYTDPSFEAPHYRPNWLGAVLCFVLGVLIIVAMADYEPSQTAYMQQGAKSEVVNGTMTHLTV